MPICRNDAIADYSKRFSNYYVIDDEEERPEVQKRCKSYTSLYSSTPSQTECLYNWVKRLYLKRIEKKLNDKKLKIDKNLNTIQSPCGIQNEELLNVTEIESIETGFESTDDCSLQKTTGMLNI